MIKLLSGLLLACATSLVCFGPATAEEARSQPKAVVELFTSQGCSSCPPADALLTSLAERGDVVALAYHVDYWDYIGWEDTFGHEAYSDHQRAYAKGWGSSRIYTPQMIVNGAKGMVGSKRHEVTTAVEAGGLSLPVRVDSDGTMLAISIPPQSGADSATVWLVSYRDRATVAIERGENAGKSMVYTQVVTGRQAVGVWEAKAGLELKLPLSEIGGEGTSGVAVLVQREHHGLPGPILGAAALDL